MKKIFIAIIFACLGYTAMSQDFSKVMLLSQTKKYEEAKKEIDEILTKEKAKTNPEAYLWKSTVYGDLFADKTLFAKYPDAATESHAAFAKYKELQPDLKALKENSKVLGSLYGTSFEYGKTFFQQSKWDSAYNYFKVAEEMGDFINKNGFGTNKSAIDTFTVLYTGYAAQNAGKMADAVTYYKKLADLKIGGKDFYDMYNTMMFYYQDKKETDNFKNILAQAKQLYPDSTRLGRIETENMISSSSLGDIMKKYKEEQAAGKLTTPEQYLGYADAMATGDKEQLKSLDTAQQLEVKSLAAEAFKKAFEKDPNGVYAYNAGVMYYSLFNSLDEKFYDLRGEGADLKAKREALEKQEVPLADQSIEWLEKSYEVLKVKTERTKVETTCLTRAVDNLANLYNWKRDKVRGRDTKLYDQYDAKFKMFDSEHDKYKQ